MVDPESSDRAASRQSFAFAPMTTGVRLLTGLCHLIPVEMSWRSASAPPGARLILAASAALVPVLSVAILLWLRPRRFEVDRAGLRIVWPLRRREIPRSTILGAELLSGDEFRRQHGRGMRIGVGGLWGGFGLLQADRETFLMWISRRDFVVIVRLTGGARPLLMTPASPERFVAALSAR